MAGKTTIHAPKTAPAPVAHAPNPLMTLREEVDRLFDAFFPTSLGRSLFDATAWHGPAWRSLGDISPHMDVTERADHYDVSVELPGMDQPDVTVTVQGDMLCISGEKKAEHTDDGGARHLTERAYGSFLRSMRLPDDADLEAVTADFAKGVLTVRVPKRPEAKAEKKIEVTTH